MFQRESVGFLGCTVGMHTSQVKQAASTRAAVIAERG
jgi:hypothetical protein